MIRILCVFGKLDRGGAESMCMNLYRKIDKTKIQFDFVKHTTEKCAFDDEIVSLGGNIYVAPRFKVYNILQYCKWWKKHLKMHPEHQIIHGHFYSISSVYFKVACKLKRVSIGHSHTAISYSTGKSIKNILKVLFCKNAEKLSDYRLACSESAGKFLFPNKDFYVLRNAIDTDKFIYNNDIREFIRERLNIDESNIVICIVANIRQPKNPLGVIEIFRHINKYNPNTRLLWIGDGPLRAEFEQKVKEYDLNDRVTLLGIRDDTHNILQAADVFMLASFFEGLPVSAIEAQASGLPCLLSDGISKETDITGLCKFLPIENKELWSQAVSDIDFKNRPNTKEKIVAAGYDVETTAKWLQEFYFSIIKERNLSDE